jgi:hypothetical protein
MGYSDQKYYDRTLEEYPGIVFGTATASGTNTLASPTSPLIPVYFRKTVLKNFSIVPTTTTAAGVINSTFVILNGTATAGSCVLGSAPTIGVAIVGTITAANATVGTNTGFTYELILNTATASAVVTGTMMLQLEQNEVFNPTDSRA